MTDVFKLIEDHGLTLHGDIEHFAELVRAEAEKTMYVDSSRFYKDSPEHKPGMVVTNPVPALAEPVAWREVAGKTTKYYDYNEDGRGEPLYTAPVAQCSYPKCQEAGGCVGACSKTAPVHASDISQERVDETAKSEHEFECPRCGHCCKEWVGLTDGEYTTLFRAAENLLGFCHAVESKLKEKNNG